MLSKIIEIKIDIISVRFLNQWRIIFTIEPSTIIASLTLTSKTIRLRIISGNYRQFGKVLSSINSPRLTPFIFIMIRDEWREGRRGQRLMIRHYNKSS